MVLRIWVWGDVNFYQTKDYKAALAAYKQGVQYKDDNPTAFYNLAFSANEYSQYAEAASAARKAIDLKAITLKRTRNSGTRRES
jgi:tetratricopeptide (TPR) repeat protein